MLPDEVIKTIYDYSDIDTKLQFHKFKIVTFLFTKKRKRLFLTSFPQNFIQKLNAVLRFKANHIEILTLISKSTLIDS